MDLPYPLFLASIAVRTVIVFICLLIGVRIFGKRGMGNLNIYDIAMVLLLGNAVQNALTNGSGGLLVGIVSAGVLVLSERLLGFLYVRVPWVEDQLTGEPVILYHDGKFDRRAMDREGVEEEEVQAAARSMGLADMSKVRLAVLEDDGTISIIPKEQEGQKGE